MVVNANDGVARIELKLDLIASTQDKHGVKIAQLERLVMKLVGGVLGGTTVLSVGAAVLTALLKK